MLRVIQTVFALRGGVFVMCVNDFHASSREYIPVDLVPDLGGERKEIGFGGFGLFSLESFAEGCCRGGCFGCSTLGLGWFLLWLGG